MKEFLQLPTAAETTPSPTGWLYGVHIRRVGAVGRSGPPPFVSDDKGQSDMAKLLKLDSLRADLQTQKDGQLQPGPWPGVKLKVRSIDYEPYINERDMERERLAVQYMGPGKIPDSVWIPILGRLLSEHILLGWEGITPEYDRDTAHDFLVAPDGKALRDAVVIAAQRVGVRELEFVKDLEKNSEGASAIN